MALDYPEQHRREALVGTVAVHLLLALVFYFAVFRGPDPPLTALGGDGVELNYGLDEAGSGNVQSLAPANDSPNREDSRPPQASATPQPQPTPPQAAQPAEPQPATPDKAITSDAEDAGATAETADDKPAPAREPVRETPKPRPQPRTLYTPAGAPNGGGNGAAGTSNAPTGNNNGDRPGATGDQGDPSGSLDAKALYGAPGHGGTGSSPGSGGLEMSGWRFDSPPVVEAVDDNPGVVRFKIKITEDGEVESVAKVSGNVSPAQEKLCRDKLLDANFVRTNSGSGGATGFYTFKFSVR